MSRRVELMYGKGVLAVEMPAGADVTVIEPTHVNGLPDEHAGFQAAVRSPAHAAALADLVKPGESLAIVTTDGTRAMPNRRVIPWLLDELRVKPSQVTVITGTGSHRPNTPEELLAMFGERVMSECRVVNHTAFDDATLVEVGTTPRGNCVRLCKEYVQADRKVILGFIEPHFFAGFSGGPKALLPGIAAIDSIMGFHDAYLIGHPKSTWGILEDNPLQMETRAAARMCPPDFLVNVTLNGKHEITGVYAGHWLEAHRIGCSEVARTATKGFPEPFDVVVTTNSGYPLDQNLYQTVKGMSAAVQVVKAGGRIIAVSECADGFPSHGNFLSILRSRRSPKELLEMIESPGYRVFDQWEAQKMAKVQMHAEVSLCSSIDPDAVRSVNLEPVADLSKALSDANRLCGGKARIAVLPQGPLTIPFLTS
jgi:lactate racemase